MGAATMDRALREEVQGDLEAGRLDAAVLKLGELAARELLDDEEAVPPDVAWESLLSRAREEAAARRAVAVEPDPNVQRVAAASPSPTLPLVGVIVAASSLMLMASAMLTFTPFAGLRAGAPLGAPRVAMAAEVAPRLEPTPTPVVTPAPPVAPEAARLAPAPAAPEDAPAPATSDAEPCVDSRGNPAPRKSWLCRGRAIHGAAPASGAVEDAADDAPAPAPAATAAPPATAAAAVPPYEVVNTMRLGMPQRVRYEVNVIVPPTYSREELVAVLADAARKTLRTRSDARAVGVFAYSSSALIGKGWDRGRALTSVDGQGWIGDRSFAPIARTQLDLGRIYLTLGTTLALGEQIEVDR